MKSVLSVLFFCVATPVAAQTAFMDWPVDCTLGETCFIEDYVDNAPADGEAKDHACGLNTRDGHKGTDIALLSFDAVTRGVAVRAAAAGTVVRTRDSMIDDREMRGVTSDKACGNAVFLRHDNGYEGLYCHLRLGSVSVKPGDRVNAGDTLGLVGLSGQTTHPHLHLTLYLEGEVVDPFRPTATGTCGNAGTTLWKDPPSYDRTLLRLAGFSDRIPDYDALRSGTSRLSTMEAGSPLVVYAEAGYAQNGDVVVITATGPDGEVFRHSRVLKDPRASQLPAYGKKAPDGGWAPGEYTGQVTLLRNNTVIANRWAHVLISG